MVSKTYAEYQPTPRGKARCGRCTMFIAPNRCSKVDGAINEMGWCKFFEERKSTAYNFRGKERP